MLSAEPLSLGHIARHPGAARHLHAIGTAFSHILRGRLQRGPLVATGDQLRDYLTFTASHRRIETVRALFLNSRYELLRDDLLAHGSTTEASMPIRTILKRALELDADSFLVVHNHPSGDPTPSRADKEVTRLLAAGARAIGVPLLDHIIVSRGAWLSFRTEGLL